MAASGFALRDFSDMLGDLFKCLFYWGYIVMTETLSSAINRVYGTFGVFPVIPIIHRPTRTTIQFIF
jgi:hypothetical protein